EPGGFVERQRAVERTKLVEVVLVLQDNVALIIADDHVNACQGGQRVCYIILSPQHALEMYVLAGAVQRAVGVDVQAVVLSLEDSGDVAKLPRREAFVPLVECEREV